MNWIWKKYLLLLLCKIFFKFICNVNNVTLYLSLAIKISLKHKQLKIDGLKHVSNLKPMGQMRPATWFYVAPESLCMIVLHFKTLFHDLK